MYFISEIVTLKMLNEFVISNKVILYFKQQSFANPWKMLYQHFLQSRQNKTSLKTLGGKTFAPDTIIT